MLAQIYLAETPASALRRRQLRAFAHDLSDRLRQIADGPCVVILQAGKQEAAASDLLILRPRSAIAGLLKTADAPLSMRHDHPWLLEARQVRASLVARLPLEPLGNPVAAIILTPALPPGSQIALDIEDHRQRVKVLEIGELAPLASMLQANAQLDLAAMQQLANQLDARLWHNGERLLFEIGLAPFALRVLSRDSPPLPLLEGVNVIGRRAAPLQHEYRLTITGDDTISADHAVLVCDGERVVVRDTSTNGTLVRTSDGVETLLQRGEAVLTPGSVLRMGETQLRLEHT